jgi:hypothetical protein
MKTLSNIALIAAIAVMPFAAMAQGTQPATPSTAPAAPKAQPAAKAEKPALKTGEYASETEAKARCLTDTVVWSNFNTKVYHYAGNADYGKTKKGAYMCEKQAVANKFRAAKNEKKS